MHTVHITSGLIDQVLHTLETKTPFRREWMYSELQDDSQTLFISIAIDQLSATEPLSAFKGAGLLVEDLMPGRQDDYSWMLAFTREGKVVEGYFGGNLSSPKSGL